MRFEVGMDNGDRHMSVNFDRAEMQAQIDASEGDIFTGAWSGRRVDSVDDVIQLLVEMAMNKESSDGLSPTDFSMDTEDGRLTMNPSKISWLKVIE